MSHTIYPINNPPINLPLIVFGIGFEDNQPHVLRKEGFSIHQILFCKSGEGTLKVNGQTHKITRNTFFYLKPNDPHEYYGNTDTWEVDWIIFSGNHIDDTLNELDFNCSKVGTISNFNIIQSLFNKIYVALKSNEYFSRFIASSALLELLVEMYIMSWNKSNTANIKRTQLIEAVKCYIDEHCNKNLTIDELSEFAKVTPQYLCRIFKKDLNIRPFEYLTMKRIQQAKIYLTNTKMSINDIAHMIGYNDCSYFCSIFKKYEMISPSAFRGLKK